MKRLLAALAALFCVQAALADTLLDNVNGYTLNAQRELVRFGGLLIGNDGRVKQLIRRGDRRPERADYRVDGRGRTLIPGLIDAHGHVMGLGFNALQLDLTRMVDGFYAEVQAMGGARWDTSSLAARLERG